MRIGGRRWIGNYNGQRAYGEGNNFKMEQWRALPLPADTDICTKYSERSSSRCTPIHMIVASCVQKRICLREYGPHFDAPDYAFQSAQLWLHLICLRQTLQQLAQRVANLFFRGFAAIFLLDLAHDAFDLLSASRIFLDEGNDFLR